MLEVLISTAAVMAVAAFTAAVMASVTAVVAFMAVVLVADMPAVAMAVEVADMAGRLFKG